MWGHLYWWDQVSVGSSLLVRSGQCGVISIGGTGGQCGVISLLVGSGQCGVISIGGTGGQCGVISTLFS